MAILSLRYPVSILNFRGESIPRPSAVLDTCLAAVTSVVGHQSSFQLRKRRYGWLMGVQECPPSQKKEHRLTSEIGLPTISKTRGTS